MNTQIADQADRGPTGPVEITSFVISMKLSNGTEYGVDIGLSIRDFDEPGRVAKRYLEPAATVLRGNLEQCGLIEAIDPVALARTISGKQSQ